MNGVLLVSGLQMTQSHLLGMTRKKKERLCTEIKQTGINTVEWSEGRNNKDKYGGQKKESVA